MKTKTIAVSVATLVVAAGVLLFVSNAVSCGQHTDPAADATPEAEPAAPETVEPAATPDEAPAGQSTADTGVTDTLEAGEESAADAEDSPADQGNIRLAQALIQAQTMPSTRWRQGKHYAAVKPAQKTAVPPEKVEVLEMFWYGCPHCYGLEPYLQSWEPKKAAYIEFTRVPATWGPVHQLHARLYYTLMALKRPDLHMVAFREVQVAGNPLIGRDVPESERIQLDFVKRHGIKEADFKKAYHSDEVTEQIREADELLRRYRIDSVPFMVINGKYMGDAGSAGGHSQLISLVNDLAAWEHNNK
jgi:thiol:disulfide interchange protein DsbA